MSADSYRVRTVFNGPAGSPWLSTLYFDVAGGSAQQAANAAGAFFTAIQGLMSTTVTWATEPDVTTVNSALGLATGSTPTTPVSGAGTVVTELLPRIAQGLVRWLTGSFPSGRQIRGRTFIPGLTESANTTGGVVVAGNRTTIQTAANNLIADANSTLNVWSRAHGTFYPVSTADVWTQFASLRSRRD